MTLLFSEDFGGGDFEDLVSSSNTNFAGDVHVADPGTIATFSAEDSLLPGMGRSLLLNRSASGPNTFYLIGNVGLNATTVYAQWYMKFVQAPIGNTGMYLFLLSNSAFGGLVGLSLSETGRLTGGEWSGWSSTHDIGAGDVVRIEFLIGGNGTSAPDVLVNLYWNEDVYSKTPTETSGVLNPTVSGFPTTLDVAGFAIVNLSGEFSTGDALLYDSFRLTDDAFPPPPVILTGEVPHTFSLSAGKSATTSLETECLVDYELEGEGSGPGGSASEEIPTDHEVSGGKSSSVLLSDDSTSVYSSVTAGKSTASSLSSVNEVSYLFSGSTPHPPGTVVGEIDSEYDFAGGKRGRDSLGESEPTDFLLLHTKGGRASVSHLSPDEYDLVGMKKLTRLVSGAIGAPVGFLQGGKTAYDSLSHLLSETFQITGTFREDFMMDPSEVMQELARAVRGTGLTSFFYPSDNVLSPSVVVGFPVEIEYDVTMARGCDRYKIPLYLIMDRNDLRASVNKVSPYIIGTGESSIKQSVESLATEEWHWARVVDASLDDVSVAGKDYIGVKFNVEVVGKVDQ